MRPPVSVIASAVLTLLASGLTLLLAGMLVTVRGEMSAQVPAGEMIAFVMAAILGAGSVLGIATAVDLLRLRQWARVSLLVFAGLVTVVGALSMLVVLTLPWDEMMRSVPASKRDVRPILFAVYALPVAIGTWWLILFTRPAMKQRFATGVPADPSGVPMGIAVLGWLMLVGGAGSAVVPLFGMPAFVAGAVLTGGAAGAVYLGIGAVQLYAGWGLLRLRERARRVALGFYALSAAHLLVMYLVPGTRERLDAAMREFLPPSEPPPGFDPSASWWVGGVIGFLAIGVVFWLLIRWRGAFRTEAPGAPEGPPTPA